MFGYTTQWYILIAMVTTGAARSVAVKLLYQTGFEAPIYVTLLYLLGQSLSLAVYAYQSRLAGRKTGVERETSQQMDAATAADSHPSVQQGGTEAIPQQGNSSPTHNAASLASQRITAHKKYIGSAHGLQINFEDLIAERASRVPFYMKPVMPGICNMFNSLLRWASLVYVAASVGEMLISGLELALSVLAARIIRKRVVSCRRWMGAGVVVMGLTLIGFVDVLMEDSSTVDSTSSRESVIGIVLIVGQCILSVLQDIAEEIFMQSAEFPPTLLLGMEGLFGFLFALILFFALGGPLDPSETLETIQEDQTFLVSYSVGLTLLFTVTGIFNIKATQVTSAMTRNIWKNLRTVLVWIITLLIFYLGGNESMGEAFVVPESLVILAGFAIMVTGIFVYYSQKAMEEKQQVDESNNESDSTTDGSVQIAIAGDIDA